MTFGDLGPAPAPFRFDLAAAEAAVGALRRAVVSLEGSIEVATTTASLDDWRGGARDRFDGDLAASVSAAQAVLERLLGARATLGWAMDAARVEMAQRERAREDWVERRRFLALAETQQVRFER